MSENFSSALRITDLNDFITPSQECIKPEIIKKNKKKIKIETTKDGNLIEITENGINENLEIAKISLNDCLACSGCITTAESILISTQSTQEFLKNIQHSKEFNSTKVIIISISPQSRASIANYYKISNIKVIIIIIYNN